MKRGGRVVACGDDPGASRVVVGRPDVTTYGVRAGATLRITNLHEGTDATRFELVESGKAAGTKFTLQVPGRHNVLNGVAAAGAARALGVGWEAIRKGLSDYHGVARRFDRLGVVGGIEVVDDYAHHPTEVSATIEALRQAFPGRRLVLLFQPHLFSRTRDHHEAFAKALRSADVVWVTDVYPAREAPIAGVSGELIADGLRVLGHEGVHFHADVDDVHAAVVPTLERNDVCVTVGAGSIEHVGPRLIRKLEAES